MSRSIERRYLLNQDTKEWRELRTEAMRIQQGFLFIRNDKSAYVSLENANRASVCIRNENLGAPDFRLKFPLPRRLGNLLFWLVRKRVLKRTRHQVNFEGRTWRINEFRDTHQGLILAEIELIDPNEEVLLPAWIKADVTEEKEYTFAQLARNGIPKKPTPAKGG